MKKVLIYIIIIGFGYHLSAQCDMDRHNTNMTANWMSCQISNNPNPSRSNTHWIMYELDQVTSLYESMIWNLNHPDFVNNGIRNYAVEYSTNGSSWTLLGNFVLAKASGDSYYQGQQGPDFNGRSAKYILITALDNYGGACYGLSEIKIYTEPSTLQNQLSFNLQPCENDGIYYSIDGGMERGGTYHGTGVTNSYDDTFDFNPHEAGPGDHTIYYTYSANGQTQTVSKNIFIRSCGDSGCAPCLDCYDYAASTYNSNPIQNGTYYEHQLLSSGTVQNGFDVNYFGAQSVELQSNFEVQGDFFADIRRCNHEDNNILPNGDFESGDNLWFLSIQAPAAASKNITSSNPFAGNNALQINVTNTSGTDWHVLLKQIGIDVNAGQTYRVTFKARSDSQRTIHAFLGRDNAPYDYYGGSVLQLTPTWTEYSFLVTPFENNNGFTRLAFNMGYEHPSTYYLDNIEITLE